MGALDSDALGRLHHSNQTLETKILRDRQTFVQLIAHLVGDDLTGKTTIIEYYQTLSTVANNLTDPNPSAMFASVGSIRPISRIRASMACSLPTRKAVLSLQCPRFLI